MDLDPLGPGWGGCVSMTCWCGMEEEDDTEKKWEVLRIIYLASRHNVIISCQHVHYTQDEFCCILLQVAGVSHSPAMCNMSVRCCLYVNRDTLWCSTAAIAWLSAIYSTLSHGKDICWCLSQRLPGIIHVTDANNQVMGTFSLTIPDSLSVWREVLLCSRWVNVLTLTYKTQLASILSISGNMQHLAQQQSEYLLQWSMLQEKTFRHFRRADTANRQRGLPNDVIEQMKARAAWRQQESEPLGHCVACDPKRTLWQRNNKKLIS